MPRAIFLEPPGDRFDTSSCSYYGEPLTLYPMGAPMAASRTEFERTVLQALDKIDYQPGSDYIVVSGKVGKIAMYIASVCNYYAPTLLLVYCETRKKYVVQRLTEHGLADTMERV